MTRIKQLRKILGYTQEKLANLLGVARSTVAMWETSSQEPDYYTLTKISQLFNVSPDFVMGMGIFKDWDLIKKYYDDVSWTLRNLIPNDLEMPSFSDEKTLVAWLDTRLYYEPDELQLARWFAFSIKRIDIDDTAINQYGETIVDIDIEFTPEFNAILNAHKPTPHQTDTSLGTLLKQRIAVLGDVAAGIPIEAITDIIDYEEIDAAMAATGEFFGLRIRGASMEPRMRDGDVVIVRKQDTADTGDTAVVLVNGDSATVKKIKLSPDGITLIPTNPAYDPMYYTAAEIEQLPVRVIGRVVELRAKY